MDEPMHEQVRLKPAERAEFIAITQRFGPQPPDRASRSALGWRNRARLLFFSHLVAVALLLPIALVQARRLRRRIGATSTETSTNRKT